MLTKNVTIYVKNYTAGSPIDFVSVAVVVMVLIV
jgi:hypothetical protein